MDSCGCAEYYGDVLKGDKNENQNNERAEVKRMSFYDGVRWEEMQENMESNKANNQVEIIKEGKLPEEEKYLFKCSRCGCEFRTMQKYCTIDVGQFQQEMNFTYNCPCCGKICVGDPANDRQL